MQIGDLLFVRTCSACPEQYDVYDPNDHLVGYVRLRWGSLYCSYPDVDGEIIYEAAVGDGWTGCFQSEEQRHEHLRNIAECISNRLKF